MYTSEGELITLPECTKEIRMIVELSDHQPTVAYQGVQHLAAVSAGQYRPVEHVDVRLLRIDGRQLT